MRPSGPAWGIKWLASTRPPPSERAPAAALDASAAAAFTLSASCAEGGWVLLGDERELGRLAFLLFVPVDDDEDRASLRASA